jgi:hypothetical protein
VVAGSVFFGVEHPFAENTVIDGRVRCALPVMLPLRTGEKVTASFVYGRASEPSQLRRAFAAYLDRERPRPSAPFLLHNTWYNLGYSNPFSEQDELHLIRTLGHELVEKRGVKIDGFVLDDGWDDTRTLWRFNPGWPEGLKNMKVATARWGALPGLWMSPWGGYNQPKHERLAAAAPEGFEVRDGGFSLAGPKYYGRFRELCVRALRDGGVGFFKFDGIGVKAEGVIDPAAGRDFDAMLRLIAELRALRPGLYVSQTVGTWPSPWWLLHVDNIWRGGNDHDFAGEGTDRQRWLTYRDAEVYKMWCNARHCFHSVRSCCTESFWHATPTGWPRRSAAILRAKYVRSSARASNSRNCTSRLNCSRTETGTISRRRQNGRGKMRTC